MATQHIDGIAVEAETVIAELQEYYKTNDVEQLVERVFADYGGAHHLCNDWKRVYVRKCRSCTEKLPYFIKLMWVDNVYHKKAQG